MAYVLGFFAADGNLIRNKRGSCYVSLEICDKDIVENIRKVMGSNHKIGMRFDKKSGKPRYRLQIGSKEIFKDLHKLGFTENKTFNMSVPQVPPEFFWDFVRGYFDGDGNIWSGLMHKERLVPTHALLTGFTSSSLVFLESLAQTFKTMGLEGGSLHNYKTYHRLSYSTRDSLKIYNYMYNGEYYKFLHLSRKREVYERFIANSNLRL